jgi:hypothetical protein
MDWLEPLHTDWYGRLAIHRLSFFHMPFLLRSLRLFAAIPVFFAGPSKLIARITSAAIGTNQAMSATSRCKIHFYVE